MTKYSKFYNDQITHANEVSTDDGQESFTIDEALVTQYAYNNVTQSGTKTITHSPTTTKLVQVYEFEAGGVDVSNTTLDFDLADESQFIQENSVSGTDFVENGVVSLHVTGLSSSFAESQRFIGSGGSGYNGSFGKTVAVEGSIAVVGSSTEYYNSNTDVFIGAVYFLKSYDGGSTWVEKKKLSVTDNFPSYFGATVLLQNNVVIISEPNYGASLGYAGRGKVYIYRTDDEGESWQLVATKTGVSEGKYGSSISVDGNYLMVGESGVDGSYYLSVGRVHVYESTDGFASGFGTAVLTQMSPLQTRHSYNFGSFCCISGDYAVAGPRISDRLFTFRNNGGTWEYVAPLLPSIGSTGFGVSGLTMNNNTLVVGGGYADVDPYVDSGLAFVYNTTDSGQTWTETQIIYPSDPESDAFFGRPFFDSAGNLLIAATQYDVDGYNDTGKIYLLETEDNGNTWSETLTFYADPTVSVNAGYVIDGSEAVLIVGSSGAIYSFIRSNIYQDDKGYTVTTSDANNIDLTTVDTINTLSIIHTEPTYTTLGVLVSFDGRNTWKMYDNGWVTVTGMDFTGTTVSGIETGLSNYTITDEDSLDFAFSLSTVNNTASPTVDQITLNYDELGTYNLKDSDDYIVKSPTVASTSITKLSAGSHNIKVNILV